MNCNRPFMHLYKLPLVIAISSCIMLGCSSNPPQSSSNSTTLAKKQTFITKPKISGNTVALLDDESFDELEYLLEATDMSMVEDDKLVIAQYGNLWDRMRAGFAMQQTQSLYNSRIEAQKSWFITRQDYINRLTARASRYLYHTVKEAERRRIPTELALLPIIESSYDPTANSSAAAAGLWQFIPSTGRIYGLTQTSTYDGRRDVIESTRAAYDFLTSLYNQFGSWELALASYNAGPGRVQKAIDANASRGLPTDFWSLKLPKETMNYVPRFIAVAQIVNDTNQHNLYLPEIANRQHFRSVPVNYGVSLYDVAQITGVDYDELRMLNPSLIASYVDVSGPNRVIIPNDINALVDSKLSNLSGDGSISTYSPNINDSDYVQMVQTSDGLAEFASNAKTPDQSHEFIKPVQPTYTESSLDAAEIAKVEEQLAKTNTLPTTSAQLTTNATIVQEPPLSENEKNHIANIIQTQAPEVDSVVSSVDGNIKLEALQTQQSVLEATGQDTKIITYDSSITPTQSTTISTAQKPNGKRSTYIVRSGDTLANIASRAGLNWRDIASWNGMDDELPLLEGSKLYLYGAKPIKPLYAVINKADDKLNTNKNIVSIYDGETQLYTVKQGDTLIGLANKHYISLVTLAGMNNLSTDKQLLAGQQLLVPAVNSQSSKTLTPTSNNSADSSSVKNIYKGVVTSYQVQSGDTLTGIASKIGISHQKIAKINNIDVNSQLVSGQKIKLPVSDDVVAISLNNKSIKYKVKSGDTLYGVANKYKISLANLAAANNLSTNAKLLSGTTIVVPGADTNYKVTKANNKSANTKSKSSSKSIPIIGTYIVTTGDTLSGIALKANVSLVNLAEANGLSTTYHVKVGEKIKIPSGGRMPSGSSSKSMTKTQSKANYAGYYTVSSGDTLSGIAAKSGVTLSSLTKVNNISTQTQIKVGQKLKIPSGGKIPTSSKSSNSKKSSKLNTTSKGSYTVKSGDTLSRIAKRNGLTTSQLAKANNLSSKAKLKIGQKIKVPATTTAYKVRSGDNLTRIAKKYGMTAKQLAKLNGIPSNTMLQKGQVILVPKR